MRKMILAERKVRCVSTWGLIEAIVTNGTGQLYIRHSHCTDLWNAILPKQHTTMLKSYDFGFTKEITEIRLNYLLWPQLPSTSRETYG